MATYNVDDDPITVLAKRLSASQWFKGRIEVLAGAPRMAKQTAPGRIVLFPTTGTGLGPSRPGDSLRDVDQTIRAVIWAASLALAWDAIVRLVWALEEQGRAQDDGLFWELTGLDWEDAQDTTKQGSAVDVLFTVHLGIPPFPTGIGTIESTSLTRV